MSKSRSPNIWKYLKRKSSSNNFFLAEVAPPPTLRMQFWKPCPKLSPKIPGSFWSTMENIFKIWKFSKQIAFLKIFLAMGKMLFWKSGSKKCLLWSKNLFCLLVQKWRQSTFPDRKSAVLGTRFKIWKKSKSKWLKIWKSYIKYSFHKKFFGQNVFAGFVEGCLDKLAEFFLPHFLIVSPKIQYSRKT